MIGIIEARDEVGVEVVRSDIRRRNEGCGDHLSS